MQIYDQHLHTAFSFDSQEEMSVYLTEIQKNYPDTPFISTEHADLEAYILAGKDILADLPAQQAALRRLEAETGVQTLFGIEIGYKPSVAGRLHQIMAENSFDMVLLSVHESPNCDVGHEPFWAGRSRDESYADYLGLLAAAMDAFPDFDSLGHIDYLLRYMGAVDFAVHRPAVERLFSQLIANEKSLEVNTRLLGAGKTDVMDTALDWYTAMGGRLVTLGSDCHRADGYQAKFPEAKALLLRHGIDEVATYQCRTRRMLPIR